MAEPGKTANPVWDRFIADVDAMLKQAPQLPQQPAQGPAHPMGALGSQPQAPASAAPPATPAPAQAAPPPPATPAGARHSPEAPAAGNEGEAGPLDGVSRGLLPDMSKPADPAAIQAVEALLHDALANAKGPISRQWSILIGQYKDQCRALSNVYQGRITNARERAEATQAMLEVALAVPVVILGGFVLGAAMKVGLGLVGGVSEKLKSAAEAEIKRGLESKAGEALLETARHKLVESVSKKLAPVPGGAYGVIKKRLDDLDVALGEVGKNLEDAITKAQNVAELAVLKQAAERTPPDRFRSLMEQSLAEYERKLMSHAAKPLKEGEQHEHESIDIGGTRDSRRITKATIQVEERRYMAQVGVATRQLPGTDAKHTEIKFLHWLDAKYGTRAELSLTAVFQRPAAGSDLKPDEVLLSESDLSQDFRSAVLDRAEPEGQS